MYRPEATREVSRQNYIGGGEGEGYRHQYKHIMTSRQRLHYTFSTINAR